jgi:hypothetical protein
MLLFFQPCQNCFIFSHPAQYLTELGQMSEKKRRFRRQLIRGIIGRSLPQDSLGGEQRLVVLLSAPHGKESK